MLIIYLHQNHYIPVPHDQKFQKVVLTSLRHGFWTNDRDHKKP